MLSKDQKKLASTALAVIIGCVIAWYLLVDRQPRRHEPLQTAQRTRQLDPPRYTPPRASTEKIDSSSNPLALDPNYVAIAPLPRPQPATRPTAQQQADLPLPEDFLDDDPPAPEPPEPVISPQVAREALAFVGTDPQAEMVWFAAINDPALSPRIRSDLIEDLNEDGFPDPRNITVDDLPLIYSRIAIIEEIALDAMDDVNAAAFAEAYKDLVNMVIRLSPQQSDQPPR